LENRERTWGSSWLTKGYTKTTFVCLLILIGVILPVIVKNSYYLHLLIMVGINTVLAITFTFLFRMGLINMAIAAFWGIGAYASALLVTKLGISFWPALPLSALTAGTVALIIGFLLIRVPSNGFVILGIVVGMVAVLAFGTFKVFGGYVGITSIPPPNPLSLPFGRQIEFSSKTAYYYLMFAILLGVTAIYSALNAAWSGRAWRAIGLSPGLAETLGIDTYKYRLIGFAVAGATAGLVGSFYGHYVGGFVPGSFDIFKTIYIQVYAIVGGLGSLILGPLLGSVIMTLLPEVMRIASLIQPVIFGLLLIVLMIFLPSGLFGLLESQKRDATARRRSGQMNITATSPVDDESFPTFQNRVPTTLLETHSLSRQFGGLSALGGVDLRVAEAEIVGLIGPNGSGKSTFFNVISGHLAATHGKVVFAGQDITRAKAHKIAGLGIGRTFQTSNLFMQLSVLDNVFVGFHMSYRTNIWKRLLRFSSAIQEENDLKEKSRELVHSMRLGGLENELAKNLSHGYQRMLSICMALATHPRLLLLDEPVAGMNPAESQEMVATIRRVRSHGVSIVMVEHDMNVIMNLCDRVVVLNYGQKIAEGIPNDIRENKQVIEAYLGTGGIK